MRPRVEIIILKYKIPEFEKRCVGYIIDNTDLNTPYQINLYDTRKIPCHFSRIWNGLIKQSSCEYIVIMDSDAFIHTKNWLELMFQAYESLPNTSIGVSGLDNGGTLEQRERKNQGAVKVYSGTPVIGFYKRDIFEKVGYFNEDPRFAVFGQDTEWVWRANHLGYPSVLQTNVIAEHVCNASTRKASDEGEFSFEDVSNQASEAFRDVKAAYGVV